MPAAAHVSRRVKPHSIRLQRNSDVSHPGTLTCFSLQLRPLRLISQAVYLSVCVYMCVCVWGGVCVCVSSAVVRASGSKITCNEQQNQENERQVLHDTHTHTHTHTHTLTHTHKHPTIHHRSGHQLHTPHTRRFADRDERQTKRREREISHNTHTLTHTHTHTHPHTHTHTHTY